MRLYPKKIHSLAELQEERKALKRAARDSSDIFSFGDKKPDKKKAANKAKEIKKEVKEAVREEVEDGLDMANLLGSAIGDKGTMNMLLSAGLPFVMDMIPREKKMKFIKKVVLEVGEAYIAWNAIKLGYRLVHSFFKPAEQPKTKDRFTY